MENRVLTFFFIFGDHHVHEQYKISVGAYIELILLVDMVVSKKKKVNTRFSISCVPQPRFD